MVMTRSALTAWNPAAQGRRLAKIASQTQTMDLWPVGSQLLDHLESIVGAAIVDDPDFPGLAHGGDRLVDSIDEFGQRFGLVEGRYHNSNITTHG